MKQTFSVVPLSAPFGLVAPDGRVVAGTGAELELRRVDGQIFEVRLRLTLQWADWQAVESHSWLGLQGAEPGPVFGGALLADAPVVVEAVATPQARMLLTLAGDTDAELADWLHQTPPGAELRRTEDWLLAIAKQQRDGVMAGFRTRHGR